MLMICVSIKVNVFFTFQFDRFRCRCGGSISCIGLDGVDWATTSGRCPLAVNSAFMRDQAFSMSRLSGRRDGMRKLGDVPGLSGSTSASVLV
jgi:hypothetical protein